MTTPTPRISSHTQSNVRTHLPAGGESRPSSSFRSLALILVAVALAPRTLAGTHVWSGGAIIGRTWSSAANWASGGVPSPSEAAPVIIQFPAGFTGVTTNNVPGLRLDALRFLGSGVTLHGAAGATLTFKGTTGTNLFSAGANHIMGDLPLVLEGNNRFVAPVLLSLYGVISGSGGLSIDGAVRFDGTVANTYTGLTKVDGGGLYPYGTLGAGAVTINTNGLLGGGGTAGATLAQAGQLSPGYGVFDTDRMRLASLSFKNGGQFRADIRGHAAGLTYDTIDVVGSVNLTGAKLEVSLGFPGAIGNRYVLINKIGGGAVVGTFAGLPQGATFAKDGAQFRITYQGGHGGNDVVLDQLSVSTNSFELTLAIERPSTNQVVVSWPTFAAGYQLQSCTNLGDGTWTGDNRFSEGARWLEIAVRANGSADALTLLSPRQPITGAPLANYASNAGTANSALSAGTAASATTADSVAWANVTGKPRGLNSKTAVFIHEVTDQNLDTYCFLGLCSAWSEINNPYSNGDAGAILIVTPRDGSPKVSVRYDSEQSRWRIDGPAKDATKPWTGPLLPVGASYNVMVIKP